MRYLEDINNWIENFVKTVCGKDEISSKEAEILKDFYVELRSKYKKGLIDQITSDGLINNQNIINYFKTKEIAESEIRDLFNFYTATADIISSKEFENALTNSFESNDITQIKDFKIRKIEETGILDFVEFKHYFKHDVAFCEVKEALGWCLAYVESGDYNVNDIIVKNEAGDVDKEATFKNILEDINKKSLTNVPPFKYENGKVQFIAAGSSEIDVKLWNESEQKIIGMSATRDRSNLIEGNQFIRHNMQINAWAAIYLKYKQQNRLPQDYKLSTDEVRKITHDYGWQNQLRDKSILKIKELDSDVVKTIEDHHMEFARHLSFVREFLVQKTGHSFHENGLNITKEEIEMMTNTFSAHSKFYFFGEILGKAQVPELHAGLNKRAYLGNFTNIMDFSMDHEATKVFLDSLTVRFNNVKENELIDKYAEYTMYNFLAKERSDFGKLASLFSEGSVYKEERGTLYRSVSLFLEDISKLKEVNDLSLDSVFKIHFSTLTEVQQNELKEKIKSCELFDKLESNFKMIGKAPSEVNQFAEVMISYNTACRNKVKLDQSNNENALMLEFLKAQGIDLETLKELSKTKKENSNRNDFPKI
jgi:hypothetical protein